MLAAMKATKRIGGLLFLGLCWRVKEFGLAYLQRVPRVKRQTAPWPMPRAAVTAP